MRRKFTCKGCNRKLSLVARASNELCNTCYHKTLTKIHSKIKMNENPLLLKRLKKGSVTLQEKKARLNEKGEAVITLKSIDLLEGLTEKQKIAVKGLVYLGFHFHGIRVYVDTGELYYFGQLIGVIEK